MPTRERAGEFVSESVSDDQINALANEELAEVEVIEKQVTKTERYIEQVPITRSHPVPFPSSAPAASEQVDDIEQFLQSVTPDDEYLLRVDLLPDYSNDLRYGRGAKKVYRGEMVFNPRTYLRDIQNLYGPGDYRLSVFKLPGHRFKKTWCESLGAPAQPGQPQGVAQPGQQAMVLHPYQQQQVVPPIDPLENFFAMAERFVKLQKMFSGAAPPGTTTPPAPPPTGQGSIEAGPDRVLEALLQLAIKDEGLATRLLSKYLGEPVSDGPEWWETLLKILEPALPTLVPRLLEYFPTIPNSAAPQLAAMPPGYQALPAPPFRPPPPPAPTAQANTTEMPLQVFTPDPQATTDEPDAPQFVLIDQLVVMLNQCMASGQVIDAYIEQGAAAVRATLASNPELTPLITMLVTGTSDMALGMLAMLYPDLAVARTHPVAISAIEAMQLVLRREPSPPSPLGVV